ncbi:hypothetical protein [Microbacterium capsulatum]|uniref:Uncharacterized protein n=1 Tax=Microbacterium capsulatum TaxID=3041921 RepID=A0ABU0XHX9_9MICO|nr:hypothetical protein [Microbacterium sp. ASV81]MDQ4213305.1 hypothetical protein [Microbacterium sp. ASV81]
MRWADVPPEVVGLTGDRFDAIWSGLCIVAFAVGVLIAAKA